MCRAGKHGAGNMRLSTGKMFVDEMFPRIEDALMTGACV